MWQCPVNIGLVHQTSSCKFPDVNPADLPPNSNFSMAAGDFLEIYTDPGMQNSYVVPVFLKVY
jgi:carnosine N-methyltransferase